MKRMDELFFNGNHEMEEDGFDSCSAILVSDLVKESYLEWVLIIFKYLAF